MRKQFDTEQDNWKKEIGRKLDDLSALQEEKYTGVKVRFSLSVYIVFVIVLLVVYLIVIFSSALHLLITLYL